MSGLQEIIHLVRKQLPPQAVILFTEESPQLPLIIVTDLDGDRVPEIAAAYFLYGEAYVLILKHTSKGWRKAANIKGSGYRVAHLYAAPVTNPKNNNLIVGWQIGSIWSELAIYEWTGNSFKTQSPKNVAYSLIAIEDMPSPTGRDGKAEIALWIHDTGEAYKIEVYRWEEGKLVPALDVYPNYFSKVVSYYEQMIKKMPDAAFYWYYLADAQIKAGMYSAARESIEKGMRLPSTYPTDEDWLKLKKTMDSAYLHVRNNQSLYPASVKTVEGIKWGFINEQARFVIAPQFEHADTFQENGLAIVQMKNRSGLINQSGQYIVPPIYQTITEFSEGRAEVIDDQGFQVINEQVSILTSKPYDFIGMYREGRALFSIRDQDKSLYGYLNLQGREVIPAQYVSGQDFKDGKAVVQSIDEKYALISPDGVIIQTFDYAHVGPLGDGGLLAYQEKQDSPYGYINTKGIVVVPPQYAGALPFENNRATVNTADDYAVNRYGLIDTKGNFVISPQYHDIQLLGENRVAVGKAEDLEKPYLGSTIAIADIQGRFLTDFVFHQVMRYEHGVASVNNDKYTFFVDLSGKMVKNLPVLRGQGSLAIEGDMISALIDQRISYYDQTGKLIWKQNTIIPLHPPYRVSEEKYAPTPAYTVYYPQLEGMKNQAVQDQVNQQLKVLSGIKPIDPGAQLEYSYTGDFSIEFYKNPLLVLRLDGYHFQTGAAHGMPTQIYVHVDLKTGDIYPLKDLFKPNSPYVQVLSDIIGEQIKSNPEYFYVFPDSYMGIQPDQPFYVKEDALYIYFVPYDIAPYAAGFPTFKIPFSQIKNIIDVDGRFWKSFHS